MTVHRLAAASAESDPLEQLVELWVDATAGVPWIRHWGPALGNQWQPPTRPAPQGIFDVEAPLSLVPEHGSGAMARPGLLGHRRGGAAWAPRFTLSAVEPSADGASLSVVAEDPIAGLRLTTQLSVTDVVSVRLRLTNLGTTRYLLDALTVTLPLPAHAAELLTFDGRWSREMQPRRRRFDTGIWQSESRAGRTSAEHSPTIFAGTAGFTEAAGEVWGAHLAWSGNHVVMAEYLSDGRRYLQLGELLHPGEVCLEPGESYDAPEVVACWSADGLSAATRQFHRSLRARHGHPRQPRPVLINTWEAVYFDHDAAKLRSLADAAAEVGVERFVLDDGWFGSRRNDRSGLGDWWVSSEVYPDGLQPLIQHVRGLGMQFGIWVEPEMVNPDSDLYRAHPEWSLATPGYPDVLARNQLVLDLGHPDAYAHILTQLDRLLRDHDIDYVKWDMNRNHAGGSGADDAAGTHRQTLAVYRLLDELHGRHPDVEIESCASGGGRIDHEILRRTHRVWTSDCNDALERQIIQRGTSMLVPPELMGAHIGPTRSHTTGRVHSLAFRTATAIFGHLGVEWDITELSATERAELAEAIALHKRFRSLLHTGDVARFDIDTNGAGPVGLAHGVISADRREALVSYAQLATGAGLVPPRLRLPGFDADREYRLRQVPLPGARLTWIDDGSLLTGRQLALVGLQPPVMHPESAMLVHIVDADHRDAPTN